MTWLEGIERRLGLGDADLPSGLPWAYLAGAILGVPVFSRNFLELSPRVQVQALVGNALPFLLVPALVHLAYALVLARLLARARRPGVRALLHLVVSTVAASCGGALVFACIDALRWRHAPLSGLVATAVVLTWAFVVPSKTILAWRRRAEASDDAHRRAAATAAANELQALNARAHPHFLFNALNTVATLIPEDPVRAEETLERFADVLRYLLEVSAAPLVRLEDDLAMLTEYLEIQRARFGERLRYTIDADEESRTAMLPPLLLLPLVENAVLHGTTADGGEVRVRVRSAGDAVELRVEDDGPGFGRSPHHGSGIALRDLERRLALLFASRAALLVEEASSRGHAVRVCVPRGQANPGPAAS